MCRRDLQPRVRGQEEEMHMKERFLLNTELAERLYQKAAGLPVIDYHNHLSVEEIRENRRFFDLYELWIKPDPYKHRAMRMCGVPEDYITGQASGEEKFAAWCAVFPRLAGNPLYHWSLMELEDVLEIREIPSKENWKLIWDHSVGYMARNEISPESIFRKYRVEYVSPCVSITGNLRLYEGQTGVRPSLRGDSLLWPDREVIKRLETMTGERITCLDEFLEAVRVRLNRFEDMGCRFADHSLDDGFCYRRNDGQNQARFERLMGQGLEEEEDIHALSSAILRRLGSEYARRDMTLLLHMGALRRTSTRLRQCAGAAGGYAAIGGSVDIRGVTEFLDDLEQQEAGLPRVILLPLNPADHGMISALAGSYSRDHVAGLVTQGPAWWWCDHGYGIRRVLDHTAVFGLLSNFPGMTTDSRSLLSFVRHDYFRRILCDWLAEKVLSQELPGDKEFMENLVYDMCYGNARRMVTRTERRGRSGAEEETARTPG